MLDRVRSWVREYFTRVEIVDESAGHPTPLVAQNAARKARTRSRRYRQVRVSPSERFVWGMVLLIVALVGVLILEAVHIWVAGTVNNEMLMVVSGLIGALVSTFLREKR